jgi:probable F420-dependent oxidoreductase
MLIGGPIPYAGPLATRENIRTVARYVERLGFDYVEVGEHLVYPSRLQARYPYTVDGSLPLDPSRNHFEIFTLLSFIAGHTTVLRLHSGVLVLPYRPPIEVAKMAASLDHLSGGRLTLGVGVGWMRDEFEILEVSWSERGALTDESLEVLRALFEGRPRREGRFRFEDVYFEPKPVQHPLPIWVAGTSGAALRRVARFGQGWFPVTTPDGLAAKRGELEALLNAQGRSIEEIDIVVPIVLDVGERAARVGLTTGVTHADQMLEEIDRWLTVGGTAVHVFSSELYGDSLTPVLEETEWFAQTIMPQLRRIERHPPSP